MDVIKDSLTIDVDYGTKILDKLLMYSFGESLLCIYKKVDH